MLEYLENREYYDDRESKGTETLDYLHHANGLPKLRRHIHGAKIAVWFSCGAASAVAAYNTLRYYGDTNEVRILNNPVEEEDYDNRRFLHDVEKWLGVEIETVVNQSYPEASAREIWEKKKFMSGPKGAPCTRILKKHARQKWEAENVNDWHVLGFTVDERKRHERFVFTERENVIPVLIDEGLTKSDCARIILKAQIELPRVYGLGFPNANCIGCPKATSPTYWNLVRQKFPEVFHDRARQSREIGARLVRVRGERIMLDELDPNTIGQPLKELQIDCGIFCEEDVK